MLNVQFSDASDSAIVGYFAAPQDPDVYPNQGTIDASDARWKKYYDGLPSSVQSSMPTPTTE